MSRRQRFTRNLGRKLGAPLPVRTTAQWIRFEHAHEPYGIFSYLSDARANLGPEAVRELAVEDFPAIVINDMYGGDLYQQGVAEYKKD